MWWKYFSKTFLRETFLRETFLRDTDLGLVGWLVSGTLPIWLDAWNFFTRNIFTRSRPGGWLVWRVVVRPAASSFACKALSCLLLIRTSHSSRAFAHYKQYNVSYCRVKHEVFDLRYLTLLHLESLYLVTRLPDTLWVRQYIVRTGELLPLYIYLV